MRIVLLFKKNNIKLYPFDIETVDFIIQDNDILFNDDKNINLTFEIYPFNYKSRVKLEEANINWSYNEKEILDSYNKKELKVTTCGKYTIELSKTDNIFLSKTINIKYKF